VHIVPDDFLERRKDTGKMATEGTSSGRMALVEASRSVLVRGGEAEDIASR
jgi:hypothetical protein